MACATRFGLSGEDGTVWVPGSACSFLRDASEHISGGCFKVPFSLETLNVVATYIERAPSVPEQVCHHRSATCDSPPTLRSLACVCAS